MANRLNPWAPIATCILLAGTAYLILGEVLAPWLSLPDIGNAGFTGIFVLFALLHCAAVEDWARTGIFFAVSAAISYGMEELGVTTGWVFGHYQYGASLGIKLGDVPVLIPLAWFLMMYPSLRVAQAILDGIDTRKFAGVTAQAAVAACVMTGWDAVMDPEMALEGVWVWVGGGEYFGVPLRNYVGWLMTTFLIYWITGWLWRVGSSRQAERPWFLALPVMLYALFALRYVSQNAIPALRLVAVFSMGVPAVVAGIRLGLGQDWKPGSTFMRRFWH